MIDPRKLQKGDQVLVLPHPWVHFTEVVNVIMGRAHQMLDGEPAVVAGIGERKGREGQRTMIYVALDASGNQIAVPASRVRKPIGAS